MKKTQNGKPGLPKIGYLLMAVMFLATTGLGGLCQSALAGTVPAAPTNLTGTAVSPNEINLSWINHATDASSIAIWRKGPQDGTYIAVAEIAANQTTYVDSSVNADTTYEYWVKAQNAAGASNNNDTIFVTTPPGIVPDPPANISAAPLSSSSVELNWTVVGTNVTSIAIWRKGPADSTYVAAAEIAATNTRYTDNGLQPGTTYEYWVKQQNRFGASNNSDTLLVTTLPGSGLPDQPQNPGDLSSMVPGTVTGLTGTALSSTEIKLDWVDSTVELSFAIWRQGPNDDHEVPAGEVAANVTTFTDSGLEPNTTYEYYVRAQNEHGASNSPSNVIQVTTKASGTLPDAFIVEPVEWEPGQAMTMLFRIGQQGYSVNSQNATMDVAPLAMEGRTLLPIRFLVEPLGGTVAWNAEEQKVAINCNGHFIELWIGRNTAIVDGLSKPIDESNEAVVPITVDPGRTMIPMRFVSENIGCQVEWDESGNIIVQYQSASQNEGAA